MNKWVSRGLRYGGVLALGLLLGGLAGAVMTASSTREFLRAEPVARFYGRPELPVLELTEHTVLYNDREVRFVLVGCEDPQSGNYAPGLASMSDMNELFVACPSLP